MKNPYSEYSLYRVEKPLTEEEKKELVLFLKKKCKTSKGYDWWRILSLCLQKYFRFNIIIHAQDRYICSEIIDKAYQHIGIDLVEDRVTGDVTPLNLLQSEKLKHVYSSYTSKQKVG